MKIIFSGGGTLGPVTPLLSMYNTVKKHRDIDALWIGTQKGPERSLIEQHGIPFQTISAGKLRRYLSIWNVVDILRLGIGFFQSCYLIWKENPDICISAGGFVSVPLHWAAWFFGVPTWIHQQDVRVGLANKLMSPVARMITTALDANTKDFPKGKVHWLGNPVREELLHGKKSEAKKRFGITSDLPVIFATGGGTGSMRVNQLIVEAVQHLEGHASIIHLSGKERPQELVERAQKHFSFYQVHQFFTDEMADAYAIADVVISRGGFGTLSELAALEKCAVIVPKPGHQIENVSFLEQAGAVELVNEQTSNGYALAQKLKSLLADDTKRAEMGDRLNELLPRAEEDHILKVLDNMMA